MHLTPWYVVLVCHQCDVCKNYVGCVYVGEYGVREGPTEGACSMMVPAISTRPRTSALRVPYTYRAIKNAYYM